MQGASRTDETLLERDAERAALQAALARAREGAGSLTAIAAHAGLGKSRLVAHAAGAAREAGMEVLAARGGEAERDFPFGVSLQLFEARLAAATPARRRRLLDGSAGLAAPLFGGPPPSVAGEEGARALLSLVHGLFWLTSNLADAGPVCLAVDDAQWADEPSLRYLRYLAQRLEDLPVAVVVVVRTGDPGAAEGDVAGLLAHPLTVTLSPRPLSAPAVAQLVRRDHPEAGEEFCGACAEATGGNPFLVRQLVATVDATRVAAGPQAAEQVRRLAPESVARAILMRLARLPPGAARLARVAAVLGDGAPREVAARLAELDREHARAAADALVEAEVLAPEDTLSFVHPVVREAIRADLPPAERAALHGQGARLLEAAGEAPERVAAHLLESSPGGDARVVERLRAAAAAALARGAPDAAVRLLRRARAEPPPPEARTDTLLELGHAEAAAGAPEAAERLEAAIDALGEEAADAGDEARRRRAGACLALGGTLYAAGRLAEAATAFERGLETPGAQDASALAARLEAGFHSAGRLVPELRARVAARLGPRLSDPPAGDTPGERALLAGLALEATLGERTRDEAAALARRAWGDGELLREETSDGSAVYLLTGALIWCDELELDVEVLDAAIEDARRRGSVMAFATASYCRGGPLHALGRLPEAIADLESAIDAHRYGWEMYLPAARAGLALARLDRGDPEAAQEALELADEERWRGSLPHVSWLEARGAVRLAQGRAGEALDDLLAAGRRYVEDFAMVNPAVSPWRSRAALAAAQLGDLDRARELSDDELSRARAYGAPRALGLALRARGLLEVEGGLDLLHEAVDVLAPSQARLDHARALLDLGAALRRAGRRQDSRAPLADALDRAERFGALGLAERAREELRVAGARPRRAALSGSDSLTPSELRVAQLAARGMTNREIAEALFVTMKTVEFHLRHAYSKLDIPSREHLAAALEDAA